MFPFPKLSATSIDSLNLNLDLGVTLIDKIKVTPKSRFRLSESIEVALNFGNGNIIISDGEDDNIFSRDFACLDCGINYQELAPNSFSFNSPYGSCSSCDGLGEKKGFRYKLNYPKLG